MKENLLINDRSLINEIKHNLIGDKNGSHDRELFSLSDSAVRDLTSLFREHDNYLSWSRSKGGRLVMR